MKKNKKQKQKKILLIKKVLELYFQSYNSVKRKFHYDFENNVEYPLDIPVLFESGTRIKNKKVVLRYARTNYIQKQFNKSLNDLRFTLVQEHELVQKKMIARYFCLKSTNKNLCEKLTQEKRTVDELQIKNLVATYQIYNLLNER